MGQQELVLVGTRPACSPKMPPSPHVLSGSANVFFSALKSKLPALNASTAFQTAVLFFTPSLGTKEVKAALWETGENSPPVGGAALASAREPFLSAAPSPGSRTGVPGSLVTEKLRQAGFCLSV